MSAVHLDEITFTYPRRLTPALAQVSADLHPGCTALLGPNGAGKSTLMGLLSTARRPSAGAVVVDGAALVGRRRVAEHRARLGLMPQELQLLPGYTCRQVLEYVAWLRRVPSADVDSAVSDTLAAVALQDRADEKVATLSGGMRQRLGLAQALVNRPRLVLFDEPTVGLDPEQRTLFLSSVRRLSTTVAVVLATHLVEDVAATADAVLVLKDGRSRFAGTLQRFCGRADRPLTASDVGEAYRRAVSED